MYMHLIVCLQTYAYASLCTCIHQSTTATAATDDKVKEVNGRISRESLNLDVKTIVANTDMVVSDLLESTVL